MRSELRPLVRALSLKRSGSGERSTLWGRLGRTEIVAATTGIAPQAAARKAEMILGSGGIGRLVVVGVAGGVGPSVAIGDLVVPEVVVDLSTGAQYRPGALGGVESRGKLATSDRLVSDPEEAARLEQQGVIAVDMETAAIAAVCELRRCPWSVFRAISDRADDGATNSAISGLVGLDGEPHLGAVVHFVLEKPKRISQLARLARGLSLATNAAATAAVRALENTYAS
jgi:adenosylhomocysteine nucleosidase